MARRQGSFNDLMIFGCKLPWRVTVLSAGRPFRWSSRGCRPDIVTRHGNHFH
jgi:hypothetical protein